MSAKNSKAISDIWINQLLPAIVDESVENVQLDIMDYNIYNFKNLI